MACRVVCGPSLAGSTAWWDGRTWTEHTLLSSADPKLTAAAEPRSPASIVSSSLTAEAYGTRLVFDGRTLTVQATSFLARVALGATSRTVQASETTALDLSTPGATKIGTFTVGTITGKMLIRYSGKQASGVTTIYNALSEAATRELIRAARTFDGLSASEAEREGFNLGKGEKLYGIVEGAHLVEIKHARGYRPQAGSGTRFRITKGISVGAGGGCSLLPRPGAPTTIDEGRAAITNARITFRGPRQSREWVFAKLTGVDHATDSSWTALRVARRQATSGLGYPSAAAEQVRFQMRLAVAEFHDAREDLVGYLRSDLKAEGAVAGRPRAAGEATSVAGLMPW